MRLHSPLKKNKNPEMGDSTVIYRGSVKNANARYRYRYHRIKCKTPTIVVADAIIVEKLGVSYSYNIFHIRFVEILGEVLHLYHTENIQKFLRAFGAEDIISTYIKM